MISRWSRLPVRCRSQPLTSLAFTPVAHLTRLLCVLLRDPLGGDWIAGRIGLLDRFIDQLLLALVQILAGDPITGRILGSQIRVNLPRVALLLSAGWGGVRPHVVGAGFADRRNGRAVTLHNAAIQMPCRMAQHGYHDR